MALPVQAGLRFNGLTDNVSFGANYQNLLTSGQYTIRSVFSLANANKVLNSLVSICSNEHLGVKLAIDFRNLPSQSLWWETGDGSVNYFNAGFSTNFQPNTIYDLVVVGDCANKVFTAYLNGSKIGTYNSLSFGTFQMDNTGMHVGSWTPSTLYPFNGNIYTTQIFNRALSSSEVSQAYNAGVINRQSLITELLGSQGQGTTWNDTSGNGNNGALNGCSWTVKANQKVPSKNLIKPFTDLGWFADTSSGGGTISISGTNNYTLTLTTTTIGQARLMQIPVVLGQTYTFNVQSMTGLYRIYKGQLTSYIGAIVAVQDTLPSTFTVDGSYNGYVTLRLTAGSAGTFTFTNPQLEPGSTATAFAPYTLVGGSKPSTQGIVLNGLSDYATITNSLGLQLTNNFTIAFFAKIPTGQASKYVINKGGNNYAVIFGYVANTFQLYSSGQTGTNPQNQSAITINDSNLHHIAYTYDGTTLSGYLDGVKQFSIAISMLFNTSTGSLYIGSSVSGNNLSGNVQSVDIYNRALSQSEVTAAYNNQAPRNGLVGEWLFNKAITGNTVPDTSGNGNTATLNGGRPGIQTAKRTLTVVR